MALILGRIASLKHELAGRAITLLIHAKSQVDSDLGCTEGQPLSRQDLRRRDKCRAGLVSKIDALLHELEPTALVAHYHPTRPGERFHGK